MTYGIINTEDSFVSNARMDSTEYGICRTNVLPDIVIKNYRIGQKYYID